MAVRFGSLEGRGNYDSVTAPNTGVPADRRYVLSASTTGKLLVSNTDASNVVAYLVGDLTVDLTDIADCDAFIPLGGTVILNVGKITGGGTGLAVSFYATVDDPTIHICEVE